MSAAERQARRRARLRGEAVPMPSPKSKRRVDWPDWFTQNLKVIDLDEGNC